MPHNREGPRIRRGLVRRAERGHGELRFRCRTGPAFPKHLPGPAERDHSRQMVVRGERDQLRQDGQWPWPACRGCLYSWNSTLDRGHGGCQLVKTGVTCNATANAASKTTFASFGFDIAYTPTSGQPALPNTSPIALSSGGIFIT